MQAYQIRVLDERKMLDEKLHDLVAFFDTPVFATLDGAERDRLHRQGQAMADYSNILGERIAAFSV